MDEVCNSHSEDVSLNIAKETPPGRFIGRREWNVKIDIR
jgi:hypothetical protein